MNDQPLKGLHFAIVEDPNNYYKNLKEILEMNGANVKLLCESKNKKAQIYENRSSKIDVICKIKYKSEMKIILFINILIIAIGLKSLNAQFKITGEFRTRTEYRNGYKSLRDSASIPAFITTQRSRVNFNYRHKNLKTCFSIQDIRVWGETKHKNDLASIDVHEAWIEIPIKKTFNIKAGRQVLSYDDQRLLSANNWCNINASHDVLLFKYNKENKRIHLGMAYNNEEDTNFESAYTLNYFKALSFLWLSKDINSNLKVSAIAIADGYEKDNKKTLYVRGTYGGNLMYRTDTLGFKCKAASYIQNGHDKNGHQINAYFVHLKLAYTSKLKTTISAGIDYFSGNDYTDTLNNTNHAFSNLYGSGHRFLGHMDYFRDIETHSSGAGLSDIYGSIDYELNKKLSTQFTWHWFQLTGNLTDPEITNKISAANQDLGYETDWLFIYKHDDMIVISSGFAILQAKKTMSYLKPGGYNKTSKWGYISLTIKI